MSDRAAGGADTPSSPAAIETILDQLDSELANGGGSDAVDTAVRQLSESSQYQSVELSGNGEILNFEQSDGKLLLIGLAPALPITQDTSDVGAASAARATRRVLDWAPRKDGNRSSDSGTSTVVPLSNRVVLFRPFPGAKSYETSPLTRAGYSIEEVRGKDCTLARLISILREGCGVLVIDSHGGVDKRGRTFFALGQAFDPTDPTYAELPTAVKDGIQIYTARTNGRWLGCALGASFGESYPKCAVFTVDSTAISALSDVHLQDALVWLAGCSSQANQDLTAAFISRGAAAYLGYQREVHLDVDRAAFDRYVDEFAKMDTTAGGAFIATRHDAELLRNRLPVYYLWTSSVEDLVLTKATGKDLYLIPGNDPVSLLEGSYSVQRFSRSTPNDGSPLDVLSENTEAHLSDNGDRVVGTISLLQAPGSAQILETAAVADGQIDGVNFFFSYTDFGSRQALVLSGRAVFTVEEINGSFQRRSTFAGLVGDSWYVGAVGSSPFDWGTWVGTRVSR